jgi:hypothetical protein
MMTLLSASASSETAIWCDDFEDGTCDEWTMVYGSWYVTDGYLRSESETEFRQIQRDSLQVEGTWSFDVFCESMVSEQELTIMFMAFADFPHRCFGYGILLSSEGVHFVKQVGHSASRESLGSVNVSGLADTWTHFDITHNATTQKFNVFINAIGGTAEPEISVEDTHFAVSEIFLVRGVGIDCSLDNITLSKEILIDIPEPERDPTTTQIPDDTPNTFDSGLLALGVGAASVIVLLIVLVNLRKR